MTEEKRYLPILDEAGNWTFQRPDLYVLIRLSVRDDEGDDTVEQSYKYMAESSDNAKVGLNKVEADLERRYVRGHRTDRRYAAMVLMALVRLSANNEKPTLGNALKLVAHSLRKDKPQTQEQSFVDQASSAFSKWRSTCHLQLAFQLQVTASDVFEADLQLFHEFLSMAKALEIFMDDICTRGNLSWCPWRVPEQIAPALKGKISRLSDSERDLVSATT